MEHIVKCSTREAEARESKVRGQLEIHNKTLAEKQKQEEKKKRFAIKCGSTFLKPSMREADRSTEFEHIPKGTARPFVKTTVRENTPPHWESTCLALKRFCGFDPQHHKKRAKKREEHKQTSKPV